MGNLTVRKLDDEVMRDLRISAARRGVSMEQEARDRLRRPLTQEHGVELVENEGKAPWRLKASMEELLAIGRKLPHVEFDQKEESDRLYDYLDDQT
jgi:plasmid stability protein